MSKNFEKLDAMHTVKDVDAPDVHAIGRISELFVHASKHYSQFEIFVSSPKNVHGLFCSGILQHVQESYL